MKKRALTLIILLIILALLGITGLQYFWIRNAWTVNEKQFDQSVHDALTRVVDQLETREDVVFLTKGFLEDSVRAIVSSMNADKTSPMPSTTMNFPPPPPVDELEFEIIWNDEGQVVVVPDPVRQHHRQGQRRMQYRGQRWNNQDELIDIFDHGPADEATIIRLEKNIRNLSQKAGKIQDIVHKMTVEIDELSKPIEERINIETLKSLLKSNFREKGIEIPFEFAIVSPYDTVKTVPIKSQFFTPDKQNSPYKVTLFPNDVFQKPHYLVVSFSGERVHIVKSFALILGSSLFFTLIIIIASVISIFIMIRQKKISDIKTDFINNMTHEFKTPIATISIAADSINNSKVIDAPDRIREYTRIIKEENQRMNARVEQVLQMALIDSKDFQLRPREIDAHELIRKAADHFCLIIARREGNLELKLDAEKSVIYADADHLRNVIVNLLDNANKYSPRRPEITISTLNRSNKIYIAVDDKGQGMSAEAKRKVFDKFYRFSTGNIHNIKGFGLGLSYVRAIVLSHKGEVQVQSELGKGSHFEISLPLVQNGSVENDHEHGEKNENIIG